MFTSSLSAKTQILAAFLFAGVVPSAFPGQSVIAVTVSPAVEIHFDTAEGRYYQLESSPDLAEWHPETGILPGSGAPVQHLVSTRTAQTGFFRAATGSQEALIQRSPGSRVVPSPQVPLVVPALRTDRPRLMFTPDSLAAMKGRITRNEEPAASAARIVVTDANAALPPAPAPYTGRHSLEFHNAAVRDGERSRLFAYAWLVSGEDRFAEASIRYLSAWAKAKPTPASDLDPAIRFPNTGMEVARAAIAFLESYDLLADHAAFSPTDRAAVEAWFRVLVAPILSGKQRWEENDYFNRQDYQNHITAHTMGLAAIGLTLGDRELVQFAFDHPENERHFKDLIQGIILMRGQPAHHREPAAAPAPAPRDGEIMDRYRHFTAQGRGIQYVHLSLAQLLYTAEIAWNNGIDFYRYTAPAGENLLLPLRFYADLFRTRDLNEAGGVFAGVVDPAWAEQESRTLAARPDFPLIYEVGHARFPGTPEIVRLLREIDRPAVPRHSYSSFFLPALTHGMPLE